MQIDENGFVAVTNADSSRTDEIISVSQHSSNEMLPAVFSSTTDKQQSFYKELKALLVKYDAELTIEDFGRNWMSDEKMVVNFKYDESFFEKENTGIIPDLIIGRWEDGR